MAECGLKFAGGPKEHHLGIAIHDENQQSRGYDDSFQFQQRKVLCPFHDESKASCGVNLTKKNFNCFGCGEHGNILDFVARMEDLDIRPAAQRTAGFTAGEALPE